MALIDAFIEHLEGVMATVEELQQKVDAVSQSLDEAKSRIQADVDELKRLVSESVPADQLDPITTRLDELNASIQGIDPDPSYPPPTA